MLNWRLIIFYVYLVITGLYLILWVIFFIARKDLRKKMFFMSFWVAFLGISEKVFIPSYYIPQFKVIHLFDEIFLESMLFTLNYETNPMDRFIL